MASGGDYYDPKVFGPTFWKTYDIIAETYPKHPTKKQQAAAKMFFRSQKYLIPCTSCAHNYRLIYKKFPPRVENRETLRAWLQLLKTKVSEHVQKEKGK